MDEQLALKTSDDKFSGLNPAISGISLMTIQRFIALSLFITKTCLYNFDPLKPHFYIVKLGFTGVYIIFLISPQNINYGYSLEPPRQCGSNEYPQPMF